MFFEASFLVEFRLIFDKTDGEKHMDFAWIFQVSFYDLLVVFAIFLDAQNLKNIKFLKGKHICFEILIFQARCQKASKLNSKVMEREGERVQKIN